MTELTDLIDAYREDRQVSERAFSRSIGLSEGVLSAWKRRGIKDLPRVENLEAVADMIGVPYVQVLSAAMRDAGYADENIRELRPPMEPLPTRFAARRGKRERP